MDRVAIIISSGFFFGYPFLSPTTSSEAFRPRLPVRDGVMARDRADVEKVHRIMTPAKAPGLEVMDLRRLARASLKPSLAPATGPLLDRAPALERNVLLP